MLNPWTIATAVFKHPRTVALALLAVIVALLMHDCSQARAAARAKDAAMLEAAGVAAARDATERELRGLVDGYRRRGDAFSDALGEAYATLQKLHAKPVLVATGKTDWISTTAGGSPAGGAPASCDPATAGPQERACLFWAGDEGQIQAGMGVWQTEGGATAVVAAADAYGRHDGTITHLFGGPLRLDVRAAPAGGQGPLQTKLGWAGGAFALVHGNANGIRTAVGLAASPPPWRVLGGQLELVVGLGGGSAGAAGTAAILYRR